MLLDPVSFQWINLTVMKAAEGGMTEPGLCHRYPSRLFSWLTGWRRLRNSSAPLPGSIEVALKLLRRPSSELPVMETVKTQAACSQHIVPENVNHLGLILSSNVLENVLGYFGTVALYKYLAMMSFQKIKIWKERVFRCASVAGALKRAPGLKCQTIRGRRRWKIKLRYGAVFIWVLLARMYAKKKIWGSQTVSNKEVRVVVHQTVAIL